MNGKKARALRKANPNHFAEVQVEHQVRDARAAKTLELAAVLAEEKVELRAERKQRKLELFGVPFGSKRDKGVSLAARLARL